MTNCFGSPISLVPSDSISIVESIEGSIVFVILVDENIDPKYYFKYISGFVDRTKLFAFVGLNSEEMHDIFDDIIIESGHLGALTTFNNSDYPAGVQEALDMSFSYKSKILFVAISDFANREFIMLSHLSMILAGVAERARPTS